MSRLPHFSNVLFIQLFVFSSNEAICLLVYSFFPKTSLSEMLLQFKDIPQKVKKRGKDIPKRNA